MNSQNTLTTGDPEEFIGELEEEIEIEPEIGPPLTEAEEKELKDLAEQRKIDLIKRCTEHFTSQSAAVREFIIAERSRAIAKTIMKRISNETDDAKTDREWQLLKKHAISKGSSYVYPEMHKPMRGWPHFLSLDKLIELDADLHISQTLLKDSEDE